jgi:LysR family transcriptional regulator, glycine cleavage system transcriptional activator
LLHFDDRNDWSRRLDAAGLADVQVVHGPVLNHASMLIDAAICGQGIALGRTTLAAGDLISGRLARPFATALPLSKTYWIVAPKPTWALPKITAFATGCWPKPPRTGTGSRHSPHDPLGAQGHRPV